MCKFILSTSVNVFSTPVVTLNTFSDVCINDLPFTLIGGMPVGGTYSGQGVSSGTF